MYYHSILQMPGISVRMMKVLCPMRRSCVISAVPTKAAEEDGEEMEAPRDGVMMEIVDSAGGSAIICNTYTL